MPKFRHPLYLLESQHNLRKTTFMNSKFAICKMEGHTLNKSYNLLGKGLLLDTKPLNPEDATIDKAVKRDRAAFIAIYDRYVNQVYRHDCRHRGLGGNRKTQDREGGHSVVPEEEEDGGEEKGDRNRVQLAVNVAYVEQDGGKPVKVEHLLLRTLQYLAQEKEYGKVSRQERELD